MPLGSTYSVNTDLTLYFDLDADLQAFTDGVSLGTVAEAADTGAAYIWNGTLWKALGGATVYSGNGAPSASTGVNGDIYIDFDTGNLYEKVSGVWAVQGDISPTIPPDSWLYGSTTALTSQGSNTNFYSEYVNNRVYQKGSTTSAIALTQRIAEGTSVTPSAFQTTTAVTATSSTLFIAFVYAINAVTASPTPSILSVTGGPHWSLVKTVSAGTGASIRLSAYSAMSTSTLAAATLGIATADALYVHVAIASVTGTDTSGTDGSGAIVQSQSNLFGLLQGTYATMSAFADPANNACIAGVIHRANEVTTPGSSFTELSDSSTATAGGAGFETEWCLGQVSAASASWATLASNAIIGIELKANVSSSTWNRLVPGLPTYKSTFDVVSTSATTTIFTQSIPGGLLETTSGIFIIVEGDYLNTTGVTRGITLLMSFGGTTMWSDGSGAASIAPSNAARRPFVWQMMLRNESSASAQRMSGYVKLGNVNAGSVAGLGRLNDADVVNATIGGTAAVNTASAQTLLLQATLATVSASLEFRGAVTVVVIP